MAVASVGDISAEFYHVSRSNFGPIERASMHSTPHPVQRFTLIGEPGY
jgi:hypothetical protein